MCPLRGAKLKVLITGSRDWNDRAIITTQIRALEPTLVIHGDALGADSIADAVAMSEGIDVVKFPANWNGRGKGAGPWRNRLMFDLIPPDVVLAFPLPQSRGTIDMIEYAEDQGNCTVLVYGRDF